MTRGSYMVKNEETSRWERHHETFAEQAFDTMRGLVIPFLIAVGTVVLTVA